MCCLPLSVLLWVACVRPLQDGGSDGEPKPTFIGRVYGVATGNLKESRMTWEEAEKSPSAFVQDALKVHRVHARPSGTHTHNRAHAPTPRTPRLAPAHHTQQPAPIQACVPLVGCARS